METLKINKEEYNWTNKPVIGLSLLIMGGSIDSFGKAINGDIFYEVGKHKVNGGVVILPTEKNQKHEFFNDVLKKQNKFN